MLNVPLTHYFSWAQMDPALRPVALAEFAAQGAKHLVLTEDWLRVMLGDAKQVETIQRDIADAGLRLVDAHGVFGGADDLNLPVVERRPAMLARHQASLRLLEELGVTTITLHASYGFDPAGGATLDELQDFTVRSLETLLPLAEQAGVVICVENGWNHVDTAERLLALIDRFRSPHLGLCYDSGHAHIVGNGNGAVPQNERVLEAMLDHVVIAHLHDNDGVNDAHGLPGQGTTDWGHVMGLLARAPRLACVQNEVSPIRSRTPISTLCRVFDELMRR